MSRKKRNGSEEKHWVSATHDWFEMVRSETLRIQQTNPQIRIEIDPENVPVFVDQVNKSRKPYRGMGIKTELVREFKEAWIKILTKVKAS